jgi:glycosyltransferase involved in cell wall biosynthesis
MDISVIIPCFNNERYLTRCLGALRAQTYPRDRYETILIDNNSTDRSLEVARGFPEVAVLQEPRQGSYAARNLGVRHARGGILVFTDSDCEPRPDWLAETAAALAAPGAILTLGSRRNARESFAIRMLADYDDEKAAYVCSQSDPRLYFGYTNNLAVRREAFERCGPFLETMRGADSIFVHRVLAAYGAGSVRHAPAAEVRHLEIESAWDWYGKMNLYGRSFRKHRARSQRRPLTLRERFEVMARTVARNRYSRFDAVALFAMLAVGLVPFQLGRLLPSRSRLPRSAPADSRAGSRD